MLRFRSARALCAGEGQVHSTTEPQASAGGNVTHQVRKVAVMSTRHGTFSIALWRWPGGSSAPRAVPVRPRVFLKTIAPGCRTRTRNGIRLKNFSHVYDPQCNRYWRAFADQQHPRRRPRCLPLGGVELHLPGASRASTPFSSKAAFPGGSRRRRHLCGTAGPRTVPRWSPDSQRFAFMRYERKKLEAGELPAWRGPRACRAAGNFGSLRLKPRLGPWEPI